MQGLHFAFSKLFLPLSTSNILIEMINAVYLYLIWGNEKYLNNFKSSSNKSNRLSAAKGIVNSLQESVCSTIVDDVMIKIYRLSVYYSHIF